MGTEGDSSSSSSRISTIRGEVGRLLECMGCRRGAAAWVGLLLGGPDGLGGGGGGGAVPGALLGLGGGRCLTGPEG